MTKEEFWEAINNAFCYGTMEQFWEIWNGNPKIVQEWEAELESDLADPTSERGQQLNYMMNDLRRKCAEAMGEDWVKEHFRQ